MAVYNSTDQAFYFKETFDSLSENHYNSATPLHSRAKKRYDLTGVKDHVALPLAPAGGIGGLLGGYLPEGGVNSGDQIEVTAKDLVGVCTIDRKAMKQAMSDKGSFVRFTQEPVKRTVESYATVSNILLHLAGNGQFGIAAAATSASGTAAAPVVVMQTTLFNERRWMKNLVFQVANAGDTALEDGKWKVVSVVASTRSVTFQRVSGTYDISVAANTNSRKFYLEGMFQSAPHGLESIVMNTSTTVYGVPYDATNFASWHVDAAGAPPSVQLVNKAFSEQSTRVDEGSLPNMLLTSPEVFAILQDIWEPTKRIMLMPRDGKLTKEAGFGIGGLMYTTLEGKDIAIVADKHCAKDRIYGLNMDAFYIHHLPDQGWWDEDGKVFLRVPGRPYYSATYGGYWEAVINPQFQFVIKNLGIT